MNARRRSFIRKMVYVAVMIPLCFVLIYIGQPSTSGTEKTKAKPGGKLAQIRAENGLDQSQWGQIDPAGEAIKLATFGMRGVAANLLWLDAIEAKKKKDWTKLTATLGQAVKLQPNYVKVWEFQAWNLSYNCSAEFDDYRDRYHWVMKGIEFLQEGIEYNKKKPRLYQSVGWTISQKIGRSDEAKQFRVLFAEDDEFFDKHDDLFYAEGDRPDSKRDNWLVGKDWYDKAGDLVKHGAEISENPLIFYSKPPMCLINYAAAIEEDGVFGQRAKKAWEDGFQGWIDYGEVEIPSPSGMTIQLGKLESLEKDLQEKSDELDKKAPKGTREDLTEIKKTQLKTANPKWSKALEAVEAWEENKGNVQVPSAEQTYLADKARAWIKPTFNEINNRVEGKKKAEANRILKEIKNIQRQIIKTKVNRGIVNYGPWKARAQVEQTDLMVGARKSAYQAKKALEEGADLDEASKKFSKSINDWAQVLRENQRLISGEENVNGTNVEEIGLMANNLLVTDTTLRDDVDDLIEKYSEFLGKKDSLFPENFPLADYVYTRVQQNDKMPSIKQAATKAQEAIKKEDWVRAQESLETEFGKWALLMADLPSVTQGSDRKRFELGDRRESVASIVLDEIRKYARVLRKQNKPFPNSFALRQFVWTMAMGDPVTQAAREEYFDGNQALLQKDYPKAEKLLTQSLINWRRVLQAYPSIIADKSLSIEMVRVVKAYRKTLHAQKKPFPEVMPLQKVLERWGNEAP